MSKTAGSAGGAQFELAIGSSPVSLTKPAAATGMVLDNSGAGVIRYTTDGSTPSATAGNRLMPNERLSWNDPECNYGPLISALKMIRETASSEVQVQYYVYG